MESERFPKVVALGHSLGARLLSRAIFSREHLKDLPDTAEEAVAVDLYLGLQGAFCARRFVASRASSKKEGAPYRHFGTHSTKVVLMSSENDEANSIAVRCLCKTRKPRYVRVRNSMRIKAFKKRDL